MFGHSYDTIILAWNYRRLIWRPESGNVYIQFDDQLFFSFSAIIIEAHSNCHSICIWLRIQENKDSIIYKKCSNTDSVCRI